MDAGPRALALLVLVKNMVPSTYKLLRSDDLNSSGIILSSLTFAAPDGCGFVVTSQRLPHPIPLSTVTLGRPSRTLVDKVTGSAMVAVGDDRNDSFASTQVVLIRPAGQFVQFTSSGVPGRMVRNPITVDTLLGMIKKLDTPQLDSL